MTFADTTTHPWASQPGPIHLRRTEPRHADRHRDLRPAEGIIIATMIGANVLIWGYVFVRWLIG